MKYRVTSTSWEGHIELVYNELQYLISFDTQFAQLTEKQQQWFLNRMPRELSELQRLLVNSTAKIEEVKEQEITFDMFWDRYDEKVRSTKKKSRIAWNRLMADDRIKAYNFIPKYKRNILPGTAVKYAETYLHSEIWNN